MEIPNETITIEGRANTFATDFSSLVTLEGDTEGNLNIYFYVSNTDCAFRDQELDNAIIIINNQRVRVAGRCTDKDLAYYYSYSKRGRSYIINQFKLKNYVTVRMNDTFSPTYSAKGFTRAYSILSQIGRAI
jgi:hypothetical protein